MTHDLILALHFFGLFMGGAPGIGMIVLGAAMAEAPPEQKPGLARAAEGLKLMGKIGMGILIVTGVILATMAGVWTAGNVWFWIKLLAVVALIAGIVMADKAGTAAMAGDTEAPARAAKFGRVNVVSLAVVLLTASFAFH